MTTRTLPPIPPHGWPAPRLGQGWMQRRAVWWLRLVRAGRVHRFHADFMALAVRRPPARALEAYGQALRQEWRARTERGPAGPALARSAHPNYLGDRAVVRGLVDGFIALLIARAGGAVPHEACVTEMERLARIFAGQGQGFAVIGGWNSRDGLGEAAVRQVPLHGMDGAGLEAVLMEALGAVGLQVLQVLRAAEEGRLGGDAAVALLSRIAGWTAGLLLGEDDGTVLASVG